MAKYLVLKKNYGHAGPTTICEEGAIVTVADGTKLPEKLFKRLDPQKAAMIEEPAPTRPAFKKRSDMIFEAKERGLTMLGILTNEELEKLLAAKTPADQDQIYAAAKKRIEDRKQK